jgi:hypothetical protein
VLRAVDNVLRGETELSGKDRLIAVHGNRFILHLVFLRLNGLEDPAVNFEEEKARIPQETENVLQKTIAAKEKLFASSYPANLFKSAQKCKDLTAKI